MSTAIRAANEAAAEAIPSDTFEARRVVKGVNYEFVSRKASDLTPQVKRHIWTIFEENMCDAYTSSTFGWQPRAKRKELFDPLSRFILVYAPPSSSPEVVNLPGSTILSGFCMFRFDEEETTEDGNTMQDVIYCYEVQISRKLQRSGLGLTLLGDLDSIAKKWGMKKVMLTVFKNNTPAIALYAKSGYSVDPISPSEFLKARLSTNTVAPGKQMEEAMDSEDDREDIDSDSDIEEEYYDYEIYSKVVL
ncbi:hypothetical protein FRB96_001035 [Tulasnella sp. 330]|nr:hypothetical protein FRB96_001035 [Tulasnella sp. 330]